jgi:hypothetical protein
MGSSKSRYKASHRLINAKKTGTSNIENLNNKLGASKPRFSSTMTYDTAFMFIGFTVLKHNARYIIN